MNSTVSIPYFYDERSAQRVAASTPLPLAIVNKPSPENGCEIYSTGVNETSLVQAADSRFHLAVAGLVDAILERFPLAAPTLLLFVGSEHNPHIDSTCLHVAQTLANRRIGEVLLIDSNPNRLMTEKSGLGRAAGLSEIVNEDCQWQALITHQSSSALDFLPAGHEAWDQWGGLERLRMAAAEMKRRYQFICVAGGDAHEAAAQAWSGICDGSYLLVSLQNSNSKIAESAVAELQTSGARLLGCVVTDAV